MLTIFTQSDHRDNKVSLGTLLLLLLLVLLLTAIFVVIYNQYLSRKHNQTEQVAVSQNIYGDPPSFMYSIYGNPKSPLRSPMGVYADSKGQIYVASTNSHQIQVFSPAGKYAFSFGSQGNRPGQFSFPYGITALKNGNLLIAETGNGRIQEFTPLGSYVGRWAGREGTIQVEKPGPLTIDGDVLYIGDLVSQQVKCLNVKTGDQHILDQQFYPHGLGVDSRGNIYVASAGMYTINVFDPGSRLIRTIPGTNQGSAFSLLRGLAVDNQDRIYAVDSLTCQVKVFSPTGQMLFAFGGRGFGDGQFFYPTGIFIDGKNRIYVADWGNNRVSVWSYQRE